MKRVLILTGYYWPGFKGGGPIQSCINMVENLSDKFDMYIVTTDRDKGDLKPYDGIKVDEWNQVGTAKVYYMSPEMQNLKGFAKVLNETDFDVLYLNGFFSPIFTIKPLLLRRLGRLKECKIILTPRGDFTGGCENKKIKKYSYIYLCKLIGLYKNLLWHATSELEEQDIKKKFSKAETFVVPNFPAKFVPKEPLVEKKSGELRLVFVSRIFPKKNLKFALEVLKDVHEGNVIFDIYGPMEDKNYWAECESIIKTLPENIRVTYKGEVPHNQIPHVFEQYHAFFFPTLGENYGHVIVEAMMNNCLVILSKGVTSWDDCNGKGGFIAPLNDKSVFIRTIEDLVEMDEHEFKVNIKKINSYIARKLRVDKNIKFYNKMFDEK
ncbi:glycosyltransferase family 4 protein [Clostridium sp. BJN0013]|uniref:glycosyltransferase family 4 protein n=1 Tax=Clostridium sp. BJN0013 TaxID=3236840 RepID=UPI0034C5DE6D